MIADEGSPDGPRDEGEDRLLRYLLLGLEDEVRAFLFQARELDTARGAPDRAFSCWPRRLQRRISSIGHLLRWHATAAPAPRAIPKAGGSVGRVTTPGAVAAERARRVRCAFCGAQTGAACRSTTGHRRPQAHQLRRQAARARWLEELHPQRPPKWVVGPPEGGPAAGPLHLRDPHDPPDDPLGYGRRLRVRLREIEEELPILSAHILERWRRRRTAGRRFFELANLGLRPRVQDVIATLRRLYEPPIDLGELGRFLRGD